MIRIYEYKNASIYKDFENFVFTNLASEYFDIPNDKVTIRGKDYRISTINNLLQCEECEECEECVTYIFNVTMQSYKGGKIPAIKSVRAITGLGLKQAKYFVENLPKTLLSNVSFSEIENAKIIFSNNNSQACLDIKKLN